MHVHVELPLQEGDYNQMLGQLCWLKHVKCVQPLVENTTSARMGQCTAVPARQAKKHVHWWTQ